MARCWVLPSLALIAVVRASPEAIATRLRGAATSETTSMQSESPANEILSESRELRTQDVSSWQDWSESSERRFDDLDSWNNGRYHHYSTTVRGHTFSCGIKGQDRTLAGMLLKAATKHFKENIHRMPSYKKVGLPAQYLCDSVHAIYNAVHAPEWKPGLANPQAPEYFQQADRDSCNIAAVAVAASIQDPVQMLGYLSDLYFNGEITTVSPPVKPRSYILDMDPMHDIKCPGNCQSGPIFVWTTALRDTRNQIILSTFSEHDRETMEKFSFITTSPQKGIGTQGGSGASYFATAQDEHFWAQQLLSQPKWTQGDCDGDEKCQDLLSDFLPHTLAGLTPYIKSLMSGHPNWYHGPSPAMNQLQNFIQKDHKAFSEVMGKYLAALSPQYLQDNAPAIIQIKANNLEGETCQVGDKIASMCESLCQKGTPCIPDHFVVLLGCDKNTCDVWTWAARATVKHDVLASQTVTLIPFKSFA